MLRGFADGGGDGGGAGVTFACGEHLNWVLENPALRILVMIQSRWPDCNPWCIQCSFYTDQETWIPNQTFSHTLRSDI